MKTKKHIVIIGGGLAGLTTAYYLLKKTKDIKVTIIEARDRLGGRIYSPILTKEKKKVDVGAFMIFPFYKEFKKLLKELNLHKKTRKINKLEFFKFQGQNWVSDKQITTFSLIPFKLFFNNLKVFLTKKIDFYEPDLDIFSNLSAYEVLKKSGVSEKKIRIINTITEAYTYPNIKKVPASLLIPIGMKLFIHGVFNRCIVLKNGTSEVINSLKEKIKNYKNGKILLSKAVYKINKNSIILSDNSELNFDELVIATFSERLFKNILELKKQNHHTRYDFITVKLKTITNLNKKNKWFIAYQETPKENQNSPFITSFDKLSSFTSLPDKYIGFYLKWPENVKPEKSIANTEKIAMKLVKESFNIEVEKVCDIQRWDFVMPILSIDELKQIREKQGKNHICFAGDYTGFPSMETAVYSGKKAAKNILKTLSN